MRNENANEEVAKCILGCRRRLFPTKLNPKEVKKEFLDYITSS